MTIIRYEIEQVILRWIVDQVDIKNTSSISYENFYKWLNGEKIPTFKQIEDFSKETHIPLGYFFLKKPPVEDKSLIEFRTVDSVELLKPSRNLLDTIFEMESIQEWMKEYLDEEGEESLDFVKSVEINDDVIFIASKIRNEFNIPKKWYSEMKSNQKSFNYFREIISSGGVIIMMNGVVGGNTHRKLNIDEFRAFTLVDEIAPLIFINSDDSNNGKLFSLLHELVHIFIGVNSLYNESYDSKSVKKIETKCNAVAAELIVPNDLFLKTWNTISSNNLEDRVGKLAKIFKCGITVIARRAYDNNIIEHTQYLYFAKKAKDIYIESKRFKKSGGHYYNTALSRIDNRVLIAMSNSLDYGKSSYTDIFKMTNTTRKSFDNLIYMAKRKNV